MALERDATGKAAGTGDAQGGTGHLEGVVRGRPLAVRAQLALMLEHVKDPETTVGQVAETLGVTRVTLYRALARSQDKDATGD